jgi:immunity protein 53 of polymorphic toxin system
MDMDPFDWLMSWYQSQCNGDWAHQHGVRIRTIDNPGWSLDVDLAETPYADRTVPQKMIERTEDDWVFVDVKDGCFRARGGPGNLSEMIRIFADFTEGRITF